MIWQNVILPCACKDDLKVFDEQPTMTITVVFLCLCLLYNILHEELSIWIFTNVEQFIPWKYQAFRERRLDSLSNCYILDAILRIFIFVILDPLPYEIDMLIPLLPKRKQTHNISLFLRLHKYSHVTHNILVNDTMVYGRLDHLGLCKCTLRCLHKDKNLLTIHFLERIPIVKWRLTVVRSRKGTDLNQALKSFL